MTSTSISSPTGTARSIDAVRRAAVAATLAPSIHNTQPWRFTLHPDGLDIRADWTRRLRVLDSRGRQLLISCGCAAFNARVALAAAGFDVVVESFPDPLQPDLVARLTLTGPAANPPVIGVLEPVLGLRRTNRRRFSAEPLPGHVLETLTAIAATEAGAELLAITAPEHRLAVARHSRWAAELKSADPASRAELQAWTTVDRLRRDGVAVARAEGRLIRDLDELTDIRPEGPDSRHGLLLLGTRHDTPGAWLRAGAVLEHVLLEASRLGYAASTSTDIVEEAVTNALLRRDLHLSMHPHVLLHVGRAPSTPPSRRRRFVDMIDVSHGVTERSLHRG